jgi:hypothetical protein
MRQRRESPTGRAQPPNRRCRAAGVRPTDVMRAWTGVLLTLLLQSSAPVGGQTESAVSDQDVAVFREVLRGGLIPPPDIGEPLAIRTDAPLPPVLSRTLRICASSEQSDDVTCIPALALRTISAHASPRAITALKDRNSVSRTIAPDAIFSVDSNQVFGEYRTWSSILHSSTGKALTGCAHFSMPAYVDDEAAVYVNRLWQGRAYGWYVRLRGRGKTWRILNKTLVWRSHPGA